MPDTPAPPAPGNGDAEHAIEARVLVNQASIERIESKVDGLQVDLDALRREREATHLLVRELIDERKASDAEQARRWDRLIACLESIAKSIPWGRLTLGGGLLFAFVVVAFTVAVTNTSARWGDWQIGAPKGTAENIEAARPVEED